MCRSAICCILPPHMLREIARNGGVQQRRVALQTLAADQTFRAMRLTSLLAAPVRRVGLQEAESRVRRAISDARGSQELPGTLARAEGGPPSNDPAVDEAYDGLGATYSFFWEAYGRHSIDDDGLPLDATVHFGTRYDNAFWDGGRMVFGDGDGKIFKRFTLSLDVIGHELAHGVTQDEVRLIYLNQPGALNESISDVFGSLIKQHAGKQTAKQADWLIGADLLGPRLNASGLRSLKAPGSAYDDPLLGKDPQPAHMRDFVRTIEDSGGVHINSGIPNHAFYLVAQALGGYAWERAGRIWYETVRDSQLRSASGFRRFAQLTAANAGRLYGPGSTEQKAVRAAWEEVGIALPDERQVA
jgi:Zn-dependent metalloprotease